MKASTSETISHQAKLLSSVNNELLCCLDCSRLVEPGSTRGLQCFLNTNLPLRVIHLEK